MRVPCDITLAEWIRSLDARGRIYVFYKTSEWLELKGSVLADHHWECESCAAKGRYTRAQTVHHEYEVRMHPDMALTRFVTEPDGERREVLHPLCNRCHNDIHGRTFKGGPRKRPLTVERWD